MYANISEFKPLMGKIPNITQCRFGNLNQPGLLLMGEQLDPYRPLFIMCRD